MTCRSTSSSNDCTLSAQNGQLMSYDSAGRLVVWQDAPTSPSSSEVMAYDGEGHRVALQVNGGTPTYYLGSLEEINGSSVTKYISAGVSGLPTAERVGTAGALTYLASDGLGSFDMALDGSGNVLAQQLFFPYGRPFYSSGTMPTAKGFTGQRADGATGGLVYLNARYYDFAGRQFLSADTANDGQNRYAYAHWNPETLNDPSGHMVRTCGVSADICTGAGGGYAGTNPTTNGGEDPTPPPTTPPSPPPSPPGCQATHDCSGLQTTGSSDGTPTNFDAGDLVSLCLRRDHPSYCRRFYQYDRTGQWVGLRVPDNLEDADYWWFVLSVGPGATAGLSGFFAVAAQVMAYYVPASGQWLLGVGASAGLNMSELCFGPGIGVCTMLAGGWGRLLTTTAPSGSEVAAFLSGMTISTSAFYLYGGSYVWSPKAPGNNPVALELGVASGLTLTVGGGNSWIVYSPAGYCNPSVTC